MIIRIAATYVERIDLGRMVVNAGRVRTKIGTDSRRLHAIFRRPEIRF